MTNREYLMMLAWIDNQWNEPSRSDYYAMRIAMEIVNSRPRKRGSRVPFGKYKIPFSSGKRKTILSETTTKQATSLSKAKWRAAMTAPIADK